MLTAGLTTHYLRLPNFVLATADIYTATECVLCSVLSKVGAEEKTTNIENIHFKSFAVLLFASILVQWRLQSDWESMNVHEMNHLMHQFKFNIKLNGNEISQMQWVANQRHGRTRKERCKKKREENDGKLIYAKWKWVNEIKSPVGTPLFQASAPERTSGKVGKNVLMIC